MLLTYAPGSEKCMVYEGCVLCTLAQVFIALGVGQIFEPNLKDVLPLKKINLDSIEKDAERIYEEISLVSYIIKDLRLNSLIQSN